LTATPTNLTCNANNSGSISLVASGGTGAYEFSKDSTSFQSSNVFSSLAAGTYTLTVKDANGCTVTTSTSITEPSVLTLTATPTNLTCNANSSGSISLVASGGTGAYEFSKDSTSFQSSNVFSSLAAGNYTLIVKDANGCIGTVSTSITQPAVLTLTATPTNLTCNANSSGSISLVASGGIGAYEFSKDSTSFQSSNVFSSLSAGNYTLIVKDGNGCMATASTSISEPAELNVYFDVKDVQCQGGNSGSIIPNVYGGRSPYKFVWSNSQTSISISNLSAGFYTVKISDAAGCIITRSLGIEDGNTINNPVIIGNVNACLGEKISLTNINFDSENKLIWYDSNKVTQEPNTSIIGQKTYFVSQISQNGCESGRVPVTIIVNNCTPSFFDLALRKTLSSAKNTFKPNDLVDFDVTVFNQGKIKAYNIDVIDYIPKGMYYNSGGWSIDEDNVVHRIDSLSAGDSLTMKITLKIADDVKEGKLINKAEIYGADLDKLAKTHVVSDIDSRFDKNPNNDIGGKANSPTDNYILGNGDGRFDVVGGTIQKYDEDDEDPALINVVIGYPCVDLALRKRLLSSPVTAVYMPNDSIRFEITVFNQCKERKVYNIDIVDYIPKGTMFVKSENVNQRWSLSTDTLMLNSKIISIDTNAVTRIDSLAGGDSTKFEILLKIKPETATGAYINRSEIFSATLDKEAKFTIDQDNDSRYDKYPNNDIGGKANSPTDDYILGNGDGRFDVVGGTIQKYDEDDEDPALFVVGNIDCLEAVADSVIGVKWFNLYDSYGRLHASINPNGQNLGQVTLKIRHYGNGEENIPVTGFGTRLMSRYFDINSSLKDTFDIPVSIRLYYLNNELNDYKKATKLSSLTINDFNIVHYDGVRENCGFEDNDNFIEGISEVLYKNILGKAFTNESFYLQFDLNEFSEVGATANKYMTTLQCQVSKRDEKSVSVAWQSNLEIQGNYYIIERSSDCKNFVEIGQVLSKTAGSTYEFIDNFPNGGINCYRLVYVDKDGTRKVLDPKQIEFDKTPFCISFPNPVPNRIDFNVYFRNIKAKEIKFYNTLGQELGFDSSLNGNIYRIKSETSFRGLNYLVITDENGCRCIMKVAAP
jgi:uncharacterized repeat protein (TIGR01451 family)